MLPSAHVNRVSVRVPVERSLLLKFWATLMFKREESGAGTRGIAADPPVFGRRAAQGVEPLASARAVERRQSRALSVGLKIAWLPLAYMPELLVC